MNEIIEKLNEEFEEIMASVDEDKDMFCKYVKSAYYDDAFITKVKKRKGNKTGTNHCGTNVAAITKVDKYIKYIVAACEVNDERLFDVLYEYSGNNEYLNIIKNSF